MTPGRPPRQPIVLDCDPGHDDALAILLAAADPSLELVAITTVAGNQSLDKTTLNARRVCSVAGTLLMTSKPTRMASTKIASALSNSWLMTWAPAASSSPPGRPRRPS